MTINFSYITMKMRFAGLRLTFHSPSKVCYLTCQPPINTEGGACVYGWIKTTKAGLSLPNIYYIHWGDRPDIIAPAWRPQILVRPIPPEYDYAR